MEEQKIEKPYVPFHEQAEKIREEVRKKKAFKKQVQSSLSPEQYEFAKATIHLSRDEAFKKVMWFWSQMIAHALQTAFQPKAPGTSHQNDVQTTMKSYGEMMSYNEGMYHGTLKPKTELEKIWFLYMKSQEEVK